jgi:hypothetical protein
MTMRKPANWTRCAIAGAFGVAWVISGCGSMFGGSSGAPAVRMVSSESVPAATGTVRATRTDDGNTSLVVEVDHLALPERLQGGATTYVVWARAQDQGTLQNLGALRVDQDLHGRLTTITPLHTFDVLITAERSPTVMAPSNQRVLSASIETPAR